MTKPLPDLPVVEINSPCPASWNGMTGSDQSRFCGQCEKSVYNLSEMDRAEVADLLCSGESICARIRRTPDGTIVTREFKLAGQITRRTMLERIVAVASTMAATLLVGCGRKSSIVADNEQEDFPDVVMGGVAMGLVAPPPQTPDSHDTDVEAERHE